MRYINALPLPLFKRFFPLSVFCLRCMFQDRSCLMPESTYTGMLIVTLCLWINLFCRVLSSNTVNHLRQESQRQGGDFIPLKGKKQCVSRLVLSMQPWQSEHLY